MPFLRPGLTDLRSQVLVDMQTAQGSDGMALFRRAVSRPLSWALSGLANGLYGFLDWISLMAVPWTAQDEYLEGWAGLIGLTRKPPVAFAATATGTGNAPTYVVPAGTPLSADGAAYVSAADATVDGSGNITVAFAAVTPGTGFDLAPGETVTLSTAIAGINAGLTVATVVQPGVDLELDADFRSRMLQKFAEPPQGGAEGDYEQWALAVPGVTRAWVNPLGMGAGTVVVYTMWDEARPATNGFPVGTDGVATAETRSTPAAGDQLVVANALYPLRPVTALVYSVCPLSYPVNFTIHLSSAISATTQAAVATAINGAFLAYSTPLNAEIDLSVFEAAIAAVPGVPPFTMTVPAAPVTAPLGYLPVRGAVTYA